MYTRILQCCVTAEPLYWQASQPSNAVLRVCGIATPSDVNTSTLLHVDTSTALHDYICTLLQHNATTLVYTCT